MRGEMEKQGRRMLLLLSLTALAASIASPPAVASEVSAGIGSIVAHPGERVTVPLTIYNITDYGTGTAEISYDPSVVHVTDVSSTQQSEVIAYNVDNSSGVVRISAWNISGVSGDIYFANITFKAASAHSAESPLNISAVLYDISYSKIHAIPMDGSFTVKIITPTPTPTPSPTCTPTPLPTPTPALPTPTPPAAVPTLAISGVVLLIISLLAIGIAAMMRRMG